MKAENGLERPRGRRLLHPRLLLHRRSDPLHTVEQGVEHVLHHGGSAPTLLRHLQSFRRTNSGPYSLTIDHVEEK